ncbi:hypothetical protein SBDP2_1170004 [Syntrophobacter sp. SbD2]|nr:hypothetical protein SBDP2_1170004 [Syntrophobacter sp. SbD2]
MSDQTRAGLETIVKNLIEAAKAVER